MSKIKNQPLRVLTDLTSNLKAQIDAQRPEDGDYSREITIRLSAIDAILAHCSLSVFNNDPQAEEDEEEKVDVDLGTLAQQVFVSEVAEPAVAENAKAGEPKTNFPDGIYRMEFDVHENRKHTSVSDLQAVVIDGPAKGLRVGETLAFAPMYGDDLRAARSKARRYAQIFGVAESETDCECFHFIPFIAEVRGGVIVEVGVDNLSVLPVGRPRKLLSEAWGAEFETIAA